ncbi:MAG: sigma-70 family RNA polymerase sigma factor [Planctomycetota bacterium]|nr:MAG: sigma-70 family RNA polymerase sigma factor [Planctomycetota bacterium]
MDKAEEKALVRKLTKMNNGAWEEFCKEYSHPLLGLVRLCYGCNREQAEDIVQMTFVRCVRSIRTFNPSRGGLFDWLKAVARNEAHTCLGKDLKAQADISLSSIEPHIADQILETIDKTPLPDELLAKQDVHMAIHDTFMEMNSRHRRALICKYVDGLKVSEIALLLDVSEKAVESLLTRSRNSFRQVFLNKLGNQDHQRLR